MPTINVKGVGNVQFPDTMSQEEIKAVLDRKFGQQQQTQSGPMMDPNSRAAQGEIKPVSPMQEAQAFAGQALGNVFRGTNLQTPVRKAVQQPEEFGKDVARAGIPIATSTAGSIAGGLTGIPGGMFVGGAGGDLVGREINEALGLTNDNTIGQNFAQSLEDEAQATAISAIFRAGATTLSKRIPFVGEKIHDAVQSFFGVETKRLDPTTRELVGQVGDSQETVSEAIGKLGGEEGLTVSQKTAGRFGRQASTELAVKTRTNLETDAISAFEESNRKFLEERRQNLLNGAAPAARPERFNQKYKNFINSSVMRNKEQVEELEGSLRALINENKGLEIPVNSVTGDFAADLNQWGQYAQINTNRQNVRALMRDIQKELVQNNPDRKNAFSFVGQESAPISSLTLDDIDAIYGVLKKHTTKFSDNVVAQKEINGVIAKFKQQIMEPLVAGANNPVVEEMLNVENEVHRLFRKRNALENAKVFRQIGLTEGQQAKKAVGIKNAIEYTFSSSAAYEQVANLLEEAGEVQFLKTINDTFSTKLVDDILTKKGNKLSLSGEKLEKWLSNPDNIEIARMVGGDGYVENIQRVSLALQARESDPVLLRALDQVQPGSAEKAKELATRFIGAKVAGHTLQSAGVLATLLSRGVRNFLGMRELSDGELLAIAQRPGALNDFNELVETRLTDRKAFAITNSILKEVGIKPFVREEYDAFVQEVEAGSFDTVPKEIADQVLGAGNAVLDNGGDATNDAATPNPGDTSQGKVNSPFGEGEQTISREEFVSTSPDVATFDSANRNRAVAKVQGAGEVVFEGEIAPALAFIAEGEGFRGEAYQDQGGVWTLGFGSTKGVKKGDTIDIDPAKERLAREVQEFSKELDRVVKVDLTPNQRDAVLSLVYNIGVSKFKGSNAEKALNKGDFDTFIREAFDPEIGFVKLKKGGEVIPGLVNRRQKEKQLFLSG